MDRLTSILDCILFSLYSLCLLYPLSSVMFYILQLNKYYFRCGTYCVWTKAISGGFFNVDDNVNESGMGKFE
jgi:hypothetical protein